jgi:serine/threonine protein phosphatase 1
VHAGVRPGIPLEEQRDEDLIWIRKPFLSRRHGLPYTVVHGHTITRDHRIDRRPPPHQSRYRGVSIWNSF